jgi:asparagine synthase (glutamine-hydrolysing)
VCGICGICIRDPRAQIDEGLLRQMTTTLRHRGPDDDGFLVRGNIGFGFRRLSIIDLTGGDQPIYNEDGTVGIVFNGEIYNYLELKDDLTARGHRFTTKADTEVIVHLYEDFGERCVDHLRGMFAFAIWDSRRRSVLLARDRLGIKPLFYRATNDRLVFASELKAILQDPAVPQSLNMDAIESYLAFGYVPGDCCIFDGISKLPPGYTLTWLDGRLRTAQYWDVNFPPPSPHPDRRDSEAPYIEELLPALREAVALHMRSDVPVGVLLSGGVDSSALVALASSQGSPRLKTFSVGFAEQDYSELAWARLVADRYNTDHTEIVVRDRDVSVLPDIVWHLDEPFADPSALPTYFVCREAARHVRVCLTGDGADEVFGGYTRYSDALAYRYVDWLPQPIRQALGTSVGSLMPAGMWGSGFIERVGLDGADRYLQSVGVFSIKESSALLSRKPGSARITRSLDPYFGTNRRDLLTRLQQADQKTYLPDDILVKTDRMSMQHSLELRPPFLDHRVVEFGNVCPPSLKVRGGTGKYILKRALHQYLPRETLNRRKMGFGIPIKHWFREGLHDIAEDLLLSPSSRSSSFLNRQVVSDLLRAQRRGMRDLSRRIWSLVMLEHWCRTYAGADTLPAIHRT